MEEPVSCALCQKLVELSDCTQCDNCKKMVCPECLCDEEGVWLCIDCYTPGEGEE